MNPMFTDLIGSRVTIESMTPGIARLTDEGILEAADEHWLRLRKDNGEVMYLTIRYIRFVKTR